MVLTKLANIILFFLLFTAFVSVTQAQDDKENHPGRRYHKEGYYTHYRLCSICDKYFELGTHIHDEEYLKKVPNKARNSYTISIPTTHVAETLESNEYIVRNCYEENNITIYYYDNGQLLEKILEPDEKIKVQLKNKNKVWAESYLTDLNGKKIPDKKGPKRIDKAYAIEFWPPDFDE